MTPDPSDLEYVRRIMREEWFWSPDSINAFSEELAELVARVRQETKRAVLGEPYCLSCGHTDGTHRYARCDPSEALHDPVAYWDSRHGPIVAKPV